MSEGSATAVDTAVVAEEGPGRPVVGDQAVLVARLVEQVRVVGLQLTGDGGLLGQLTARVLGSALEGWGHRPVWAVTRATRWVRTAGTRVTVCGLRRC